MPTPVNDTHRALVKQVYDLVRANQAKLGEIDQLMDLVTQKISPSNPFVGNEDWEEIVAVYTPLFDQKRDANLVAATAIPNFIP